MFNRILPTTLLQIFCENLLYFQVIFKSMKIADDTFPGNSECEWVNQDLKTGCLKLAIVKYLGVLFFKGDSNIPIFQR